MPARFEHHPPADNPRIFVVEADEVIRSALQFILKSHGETSSFKTLDQAFIHAAVSLPDIILLGTSIVEHRGKPVLTEIAARMPGAKILMVADTNNDPVARQGLEWGAHGILGKPITVDSVRDKVSALLDDNGMTGSPSRQLPLSATW